MTRTTIIYNAYSCSPSQAALDDTIARFRERWGYWPVVVEAPENFPLLNVGHIPLRRYKNIPPGHVFLATKETAFPLQREGHTM